MSQPESAPEAVGAAADREQPARRRFAEPPSPTTADRRPVAAEAARAPVPARKQGSSVQRVGGEVESAEDPAAPP